MSGRSENYYAPNKGRLFRAAERDGGYFGRGSYWTTRYEHAQRFAHWAEHEQTVFVRSDLAIWTVEIDESEDASLI